MHYYNVDFRFCLNISGRLTSESWLDSSNNAVNTFTYQYDILGNLLSAFDGVSSSDYTYDTMNRIDSMTIMFDAQMAVFSYTYDTLGRQTESSLRLNGGQDRTINIEYDYLGRALSAELTGNALNDILAEFDYNAVGALTDVRRFEWDDTDELYNLIALSQYQYNARNQITSITHQDSNNNNIVSHGYLYDADGNISQYTNSLDGSVLYDYDFLGQLTGADYSNLDITDESYQYDLNGNRELVTNANGDLVVYSTGLNNELNSDGNYSYTYDAEGNRISKINAVGTERELYSWDYRNRLSSVTKQEYNATTQEWEDVQIVEYAYDYNNVLIRKVLDANGDGVSDSKTIFIPEDYQVAIQLDDADLSDLTDATVSHRYLWTPEQQDKLLADVTPTETLWTLTDHLGTIRDIVKNTPSGLVVPAHIIYDAYGNILSCKDPNGTDVSNPIIFGFTGKYFDTDTQLQNNVNRWYDAVTGRWLSTDPIGFNGNDTNLYRYVNNRSNINKDIDGLQCSNCLHLISKNRQNYSIENCSVDVYYTDLAMDKRHSCIQLEWTQIYQETEYYHDSCSNRTTARQSYPRMRITLSFELVNAISRSFSWEDEILASGPSTPLFWNMRRPITPEARPHVWAIVMRPGRCSGQKDPFAYIQPNNQSNCDFLKNVYMSARNVAFDSRGVFYCLPGGYTCNSVTAETLQNAGGLFIGSRNNYPGCENPFSSK